MEYIDKPKIHTSIDTLCTSLDQRIKQFNHLLARYVPHVKEHNGRLIFGAEKLTHPELILHSEASTQLWPIADSICHANKKMIANNTPQDDFKIIAEEATLLAEQTFELRKQFRAIQRKIILPKVSALILRNLINEMEQHGQKICQLLYFEAGIDTPELLRASQPKGWDR